MAKFSVKEKVALITGGTAGIGLDFAKELLKNGAKGVALAGSTKERGISALKELVPLYGDNRVIFVQTDTSVEAQFESAIKKTIEKFGHIDILMNNAGIFDDSRYDRELAINVNGTTYGCILAWKYLSEYKSGDEAVVLNLSSTTALMRFKCLPIYASTKAMIIALTRNFGHKIHYERTKVRFAAVCPGVTLTPLIADASPAACLPGLAQYFDQDMPLFIADGQECTATSEGLLRVAEDAETGSVWVINNSQMKEITISNLIPVPSGFE